MLRFTTNGLVYRKFLLNYFQVPLYYVHLKTHRRKPKFYFSHGIVDQRLMTTKKIINEKNNKFYDVPKRTTIFWWVILFSIFSAYCPIFHNTESGGVTNENCICNIRSNLKSSIKSTWKELFGQVCIIRVAFSSGRELWRIMRIV